MQGFANSLFLKLGNSVKLEEPINTKCTFKIGGMTKFYIRVCSVESLSYVLRVCKSRKIRWFLLGGGSNVLFPQFFNGVVIDIKSLNKIQIDGTRVFASAGAMLVTLCQQCKLNGLGGLEWAVGIPGTVGGAVKMNAGAFNHEFMDFVSAVYVLDNGNILCKEIGKADYCYRGNKFLKPNQIVLGVDLKLIKANKSLIESKLNGYIAKRKLSQNVGFPSAGSVFKKTKIGSASLLIDQTGLKGFRVGDAMVSTKHAGFIVNVGNATMEDVLNLSKVIKRAVYKKFKQKLCFEICVV